YTLTAPTLTSSISAKQISVTGLSGNNTIYNATTTASLSGTAALLAAEAPGTGTTSDFKPYTGDTVNVTGTPVGTYASKNVANGVAITITGNTLTGAQANNYSIVQQTGVTADITPKALTAQGSLSGGTKIYDATTIATPSGSAALQTAEAIGAGNDSDGKYYTGDNVILTGTPIFNFNSKEVGTYN